MNTQTRTPQPENEIVQIIIPTWNALEFTKMTLKTLFQYTTDHPYHLTIVENASSDATPAYLRELEAELNAEMPEGMVGFNFVFNEENEGYSLGNITGWESVEKGYAKYACLCNNDLVFSPGWLSRMVDIMRRDPEIGIMGSMRPAPFVKHPHVDTVTGEAQMREMLSSLDLSVRQPEAELQAFTGGTEWEQFVEEIEAANYKEPWMLQTPPAFVMTCCAIVDKEAADAAGGVFREDWGSTYGADDIDLSWRLAHRLGKKIAMAPVYVHHHVHAAVDDGKLNMDEKLREGDIHLYNVWKDVIKAQLRRELAANPNFREEVMYTNPEWFIYRIMEHVLGEEEFWADTEISGGVEVEYQRNKAERK